MRRWDGLSAGDPTRVGRYALVARLGSGGMGRVYLARPVHGGRSVALKVVRPELAEDATFRRRFAREVAAARRVDGRFTAALVDADPEGDPPWLATVYVPGPTLATAVGELGRWPVGPTRDLAFGLVDALAAVHAAGVVHRDLTPANVLLAADGPRVIDFGISRAAEASVLTRTGAPVGTPGFLAPEVLTGSPAGPPADVFALGAVLAFAALGVGPFGTGPAPALNFRVVYQPPLLDALPDALRPVVAPCLARNPAHRPDLAALRALLTGTAGEGAPGRAAADRWSDWLPEPVAALAAAVAESAESAAPETALTTPPPPMPSPEPDSARSPDPEPDPDPAPGPDPAPDPDPHPEPDSATEADPRPEPAPGSGPAGVPPAAHPTPERGGETGSLHRGWSRRQTLAGLGALLAAGAVGYGVWRAQPGPRPRWSLVLGAAARSRPVRAGALVYALTRDDTLHAVDPTTGERHWSTGDVETLTLAGGLLFARNADGEVRTVDRATGRPGRSPVGDRMPAPNGDSDQLHLVRDGALRAMDPDSGVERWSRPDVAPTRPPVLGDQGLYLVTRDGAAGWRLLSLDPDRGTERWRSALPDLPLWVTAGGGSVLVTGNDRAVTALEESDGTRRWSSSPSGGTPLPPVLGAGTVYHPADGRLTARESTTGAERWSVALSPLAAPEYAERPRGSQPPEGSPFPENAQPPETPVAAAGPAVCACTVRGVDGVATFRDPDTGAERWRFTADAPASPPLAVDDLLVVAFGDRLYGLPLDPGAR